MYYADRSTYQIFFNRPHVKRLVDFESQAKTARESRCDSVPFSLSRDTAYDYPLFIEGEIDVGNGKTQHYRVYEITEAE